MTIFVVPLPWLVSRRDGRGAPKGQLRGFSARPPLVHRVHFSLATVITPPRSSVAVGQCVATETETMPRILVIDDDPDIREFLSDVLTAAGHTVFTADDGRAGLRRYWELRPELVITDIFMPENNGLDVILELASTDTSVIAISGGGHIDNVNYLHDAISFGARCTLTKPFTIAALLSAVNEALMLDPAGH